MLQGLAIQKHTDGEETLTRESRTTNMHSNGVASISQGNIPSIVLMIASADNFEGTANLIINDDDRPRDQFAAYDSEPPPAPKLKSKGVIAMDITEQFTHAAQRTC